MYNLQNANCYLFFRFGLKNQPPSNTNVPFKIDYGNIEKLLSNDDEQESTQYNLEEIPDLASILNYKPVLPTTASRYTDQGGQNKDKNFSFMMIMNPVTTWVLAKEFKQRQNF